MRDRGRQTETYLRTMTADADADAPLVKPYKVAETLAPTTNLKCGYDKDAGRGTF